MLFQLVWSTQIVYTISFLAKGWPEFSDEVFAIYSFNMIQNCKSMGHATKNMRTNLQRKSFGWVLLYQTEYNQD